MSTQNMVRKKKARFAVGLVENDVEFLESVTQRISTMNRVRIVRTWGSAEECLRDRRRRDLDILFLDIVLPYMNGVDLAREVSRQNPDIKIIMLTNMNSDGLIFDSIKNGALGYVLKSELGDIEQIIEVVADGGAMITPTIALRVVSSFRKIQPRGPHLTHRERQVLELLVRGKKVTDVAQFLDLTMNTVQGYIKEIYKKLNVHSRMELAQKADELALL